MPKDSVRTSQASQCFPFMKTNHVEHLYGKSGELLGAFTKFRKATISFVVSILLSVRPSAWKDSSPNGRIFMKFGLRLFFDNLSRKLKLYYDMTRMTGILHGGIRTFVAISRTVILRIRNTSGKGWRKNQNTHFIFRKFFRKLCRL
jgi:hypothetical protein